MVEPEPREIGELIASIPIRSARDADWNEFAERFVKLCAVFEIDASMGPDGGIRYRDADPEDTSLILALQALLARRLNHGIGI